MAFVPALAIGGAALSAGSALMSGISTSNTAAYQAQIAKNLQITSNYNATEAEEAGEAQAQASSLKGAAVVGKTKAAQAANGIDVNTGSAVAVRESEAENSQLDTENTEHNALLSAYGYRQQAVAQGAEAQLDEQESEEAVPGSILSAGGNLLTAASGVNWPKSGTPANPFNIG